MTVWDADYADARWLAPRLRPEDVREIENLRISPVDYLTRSIEYSSHALCIELDAEPVCLAGVLPTAEPGIGIAWMNSTERVNRCRPFLRQSKNLLEQLSAGYMVLTAFASVGNQHHLRWAEWIGFRMFPTPVTLLDKTFHHFYHLCPQQPSR